MKMLVLKLLWCGTWRLGSGRMWDRLFQRWDRRRTEGWTEIETLKKQSGTQTECKTPNGTEVGTEVGPKWEPNGTKANKNIDFQ